MKIYYRLLGIYVRPIGEKKNGNESVHESALKRQKEVDSYQPENLLEYLESKKN